MTSRHRTPLPPHPSYAIVFAMDSTTLKSLSAALAASPENTTLRMVLVAGLLEVGEADEAAELLEPVAPDTLASDGDRVTAAQACLAAGLPTRALRFADGEAAQLQLERARALLALDRKEDGLACYRRAVAANAALEDHELAQQLGATAPELHTDDGDRPRLRVVSNDDTGAEDLRRLLQPAEERITFAQVGGLDQIKQRIRRKIIVPFEKPSLFQRFRKRIGGGILLFGPPGCGKTLLARATAGECNASFYNVAISDILDMWLGESERKLHEIFETARSHTPSVLFFDELEGLGGKRQYSRDGASAKLVSQFLSEMDGFTQANSGVLVLAATNVPWAIDPAFRRPGRFDRLLFVPPPDRPAREAILDILLTDRPCEGSIDVGWIARHTSGFSGADLSEVVETAVDEAIEASLAAGEETPLQQDHFRRALDEVRPTTLEWLTTARNYARYANEGGQYDEVLRFLEQHGRS